MAHLGDTVRPLVAYINIPRFGCRHHRLHRALAGPTAYVSYARAFKKDQSPSRSTIGYQSGSVGIICLGPVTSASPLLDTFSRSVQHVMHLVGSQHACTHVRLMNPG